MKSQDIGLLFKLICLQYQDDDLHPQIKKDKKHKLQLTQSTLSNEIISKGVNKHVIERYSVRAIAKETGISKSQVSLSIQRCIDIGLAKRDRKLDVPRTNINALFEFVAHSIRYVFPTKAGVITRGIATSLGAPVLKGKLMTGGDLLPVWADARGDTKGQTVEPLFKTVPYAVRKDSELYAFLALVDAIRLGQPRERNLAIKQLQQRLKISNE